MTQLVAQERQARVVGGQPVAQGEYPWTLALVEAGKTAVTGHYCGASLIAPTWAVTAAHCLSDPPRRDYMPADVQVVAAHVDLQQTLLLDVKQIIVHPDFSFNILENDIALLELAEPVDLPIVTLLDEADYSLPTTLSATVLGWGSTSNLGRYPDTLMAVSMPLLDNELCEKLLVDGKVIQSGELLPSMLCAGGMNLGRDSCTADSGGPLIIHNPNDDTIVQIGLVSYGADRCGYFPGVYTRLSAFQEFIKSHVAEVQFTSLDPLFGVCQEGITPVPESPSLTVSVAGNDAELLWTAPKFAEGYTLFYLPFNYRDLSELNSLDLGQQIFLKGHLEQPQNYYVAIQAYNCSGESRLSNVGLLWFSHF
ncbi:trypsin-like serine protease [Thioflexithrix psekupsensis]|nr:trypsin-like serine protease [Thioflexithrix psekupsensis]